MANWFYYDKNGQKKGPVSDSQLKYLVQQGTITADTQMESEWGHKGTAGQIPGLIPKTSAPANHSASESSEVPPASTPSAPRKTSSGQKSQPGFTPPASGNTASGKEGPSFSEKPSGQGIPPFSDSPSSQGIPLNFPSSPSYNTASGKEGPSFSEKPSGQGIPPFSDSPSSQGIPLNFPSSPSYNTASGQGVPFPSPDTSDYREKGYWLLDFKFQDIRLPAINRWICKLFYRIYFFLTCLAMIICTVIFLYGGFRGIQITTHIGGKDQFQKVWDGEGSFEIPDRSHIGGEDQFQGVCIIAGSTILSLLVITLAGFLNVFLTRLCLEFWIMLIDWIDITTKAGRKWLDDRRTNL
ncbi:MAG: GYF domain-containing protein [Planctomycetia bacterium]|nr:GYF domain-containing protein [Planctomycetia bacterium]